MSRNEIRIKPQDGIFRQMGIENVSINEIVFYERNKKMKFMCSVPSVKDLKELDIIYENIKKNFGKELEVDFKVEYTKSEIMREELVTIVEKAIIRLKARNAISKSFLYFYRIRIEETVIDIELNDKTSIEILLQTKIDEKLEKILENYGIYNFKVKFIHGDFSKELTEVEAQKQKEMISLSAKIDSENRATAANKPQRSNEIYVKQGGFQRQSYSSNKTKEIKGNSISLTEFFELYEDELCVVEGEVFSIESRDIRNEKILLTIRLTDEVTSLTSKVFCDKDKPVEVSVGDFIKISGKKQIDRYSDNEEVIMINSINKLEKTKAKKEDKAEVKMVELHTHSKMSEMVGVEDIGDLIKRAISYGHKAMAITDYSVVHAFPFAYKAAKGKDFKAILGCEMYMVDDTLPMVRDCKTGAIEDTTFVVFDLETFGLNSHKNEIIEIGAIKLKGTRIVDTFSSFVNPNKIIPKKISELTHITQDMVDNAPTIEDVLPKFLEFTKDAVMVAHNSAFDMGFIRRDAKKYMEIDYKPPIIDTLQMARDLYPDLKGYNLDRLNKTFKLSLENHHRAIDDAQSTAKLFIMFLEKYIETGVVNVENMNGASPLNIQKQATRNIMVIAKNLTGLQNLYRLVSESHINYYGSKKPRVLKSRVNELRDGLIVGSSLTSHFSNDGELAEYYMRYDLENVEKNIDFYDYIELLPRATYAELYEEDGTGTISSFEQIEDMNRYFYNLAKERGKLVTASSNVHYNNEEDYKIRSILLYGSGNVFRENQYKTDNKFYFRTTDELLDEFSYLGEEVANEIVVKNTNAIADMVEVIKPVPDGFYPPKIDNAENIVKEMTYEKAYRIYGNPLPEIVKARLERELGAIIGNGFSVLYLSAQKLVKKSLDSGYLVGSRGSVGSSLVAFMMGITEVNALYPHYICTNPECKNSEFIEREGVGIDLPEKICPKCGQPYKRDGYSIPFEVFMGFNGEKVPDIDLNFSGEYQSEIHRYCEQLFGKENVFKAGTISTLAEKNAEGYVKKYFEDHELKNNRAEIIRLAKKVEGAKKTTGQHPGGMVVVPRDHNIYEFCPVQKPANDITNDSITTHFDYHVMDEQLVKLDILGHDDPTTIKMLQEYTGVDIYSIPIADPETLKIFSSTESLGITPEDINSIVGTFGVPEFGTPFVRQMLIDTMPKTFAELVRISGLSHGTDVWLNNAQEFIRQKKATLSQVITVRDDIMNYLIDQGIEKGTAFKIMEFVRKGKPSKDPEGWKKFSDLMKEHNVAEWYIESCRRIKYMFPKGHAVAYVMMAMRIAYFKVHYPLAFYAAYLSRKAEDFDFDIMGNPESAKNHLEVLSKEPKLDVKKKAEMAICEIIVEMYARGFQFLPIDIYKSGGTKFTIEDGKIRIPLIGLSGLGGAVIDNILKERELDKFLSYEDLKRRTKVSQTIVEKLKSINAVDSLSETNQISLF
ncbi:PolC-type DNA polymerase III [Fusobacterium sp.]|uniref:PolC-type DNA polymerase III n=1 Tax=Fusobacterium sp. TaxID=68766 RepID=UPI001D9C4FEC|nr:PolC-type DNA polymerase III [Fusobacterium sp.]MBS5789638.1 PolC-type DNA polymerase III [Fusobacterium sp.]